MKYSKVAIQSIAYELPSNVVSSVALEERLAPLYREMHLQVGQLEALTGIKERRYWEPGQTMADGAIKAGRKALAASGFSPADVGMLIYGAVCRDFLEPATACAVADGLGLGTHAEVFDLSNACLGTVQGIVHIARAIEAGYIKVGMVVACESSRQIVDLTIERMLRERNMDNFRVSLATLTGGSGAIGIVVCNTELSRGGHRVLNSTLRSDTSHHRLCCWGPDTGIPSTAPMQMRTDASAILENGVALGIQAWRVFLDELGWAVSDIDRTICHQVGAPHRNTVMRTLGFPIEKDFQTYEFLGNVGTVSLPITAAIAEQRGFLEPGQRVAMLGIGSGLNCQLLGVEW